MPRFYHIVRVQTSKIENLAFVVDSWLEEHRGEGWECAGPPQYREAYGQSGTGVYQPAFWYQALQKK